MEPESSQELKEKYLALLNKPGVKAVMDWRVPNNDDAIDDEQKEKDFAEDADAYISLVEKALGGITPGGHD